MEKNPISFLQEYFAKRQIVPKYTVIESRNGTHLNWFKFRLDCGSESIDGEGMSKKEAKTNAATGMMKLLGLGSSNGFVATNEAASGSTTPNINHIHASPSPSTSNAVNMTINYVGRLQEMAQQQGTTLPAYQEKSASGPAHLPTFTIACKFNGMEEEASALNKKDAKTMAAKKMWQRINPADTFKSEELMRVCKSEGEMKSYLDTVEKGITDLKILEDNKNAMAESADKALKLYIPLSKINVSKKVNLQDKRSYSDYHTFLRDSFSDKDRESVMDKLQDTIRACQAYENNVDGTNPLESLKTALKDLSIDVKEVNVFEKEKKSIFGLQLDTDPVISEIGQGATKSTAEIQSVLQMAVTVSILIA